ncbi:uncharacterized protein LOC130135407, partial [Syzygium oleosum]|uniref:uncharacterized protein LOC130135407 n=1 Tax=Syzygium oleosum TaxID=219896 RepID=UPI0024B9C265
MNHRSPHPTTHRRPAAHAPPARVPSDWSLQTFPPEGHADLVRRRGGLISVPWRLALPPWLPSAAPEAAAGGPARLLLNVTVERSLGPVQVVMAAENSVGDLVRASVEAYGKEKRRPLLRASDPRCFELHYSPFSLECEFSPHQLFSFLKSTKIFYVNIIMLTWNFLEPKKKNVDLASM